MLRCAVLMMMMMARRFQNTRSNRHLGLCLGRSKRSHCSRCRLLLLLFLFPAIGDSLLLIFIPLMILLLLLMYLNVRCRYASARDILIVLPPLLLFILFVLLWMRFHGHTVHVDDAHRPRGILGHSPGHRTSLNIGLHRSVLPPLAFHLSLATLSFLIYALPSFFNHHVDWLVFSCNLAILSYSNDQPVVVNNPFELLRATYTSVYVIYVNKWILAHS